jgi:hypothetical protein
MITRWFAHVAGGLWLMLTALAACAATDAEKAERLAQLLANPSVQALVIAVVLVIGSVAIWISSRILGIEGGFWRSVVAAIIAGVLGAIGSALFGSHPSFLVSCVLGFVTGTIAIKLCMEASLGNALVCSVLSSIMTAILVFVAIVAFSVKTAIN